MNKKTRALSVDVWLDQLDAADAPKRFCLPEIYGNNPALWQERCARIAQALRCYREHFGNVPVRLFRAPGRINLRGMHVDTHGGYLNLMTHQREIVVVAGEGDPGITQVANTDAVFVPLSITKEDLPRKNKNCTWSDFIEGEGVQTHVSSRSGYWGNYIEGAWLRAGQIIGEKETGGLNLVVDSNLPRGAALSSSAALCLALLHAWLGWKDHAISDDRMILAAQDAEWYTGSRCGTCDQAAIQLGKPGHLIHGALYPKAFTIAGMKPVALPDALRILVINSFTRRSISGAEKVAYTRNRFAYSMALEIFQQTLHEMGYASDLVAHCDRLAHIMPEALGGDAALYAVLKRIPECLDLEVLRSRYDLPDLDHEYIRYFGDVEAGYRPTHINLRGPLLFGIAESERARHFAAALQRGDYRLAGRFMTWGHDGDRRIDPAGMPVQQPTSDVYLDKLIADATPIVQCPGAYGASSPALDRLVDAALEHGALGASLTGAGIAGTVLALCREEDAEGVARGLRKAMGTQHYQQMAAFSQPLTTNELDSAVIVNHAVSGAGEIGCSA